MEGDNREPLKIHELGLFGFAYFAWFAVDFFSAQGRADNIPQMVRMERMVPFYDFPFREMLNSCSSNLKLKS